MSVLIRDFVTEDFSHYLSMSKAFYQSSAVMHTIPHEHFIKTFEMCISGSPYVRGLMTLVDNTPAGFALLSLTHSNEAGGICVLIEEAYILAEFQGQGLGSSFFHFLEEEYRNKAKRLRLEVTRQNEGAVRLYQRLGFEKLDYLQMIRDFQ